MRSRVFELTCLIAAAALSGSGATDTSPVWFVSRSPHFEVYSQAGPEPSKRAIARLEELRSFFDRTQIVQSASGPRRRPPVRVIGFSSRKEYDAFKIQPMADAYYTGTADRDYIVMPMLAIDFGGNDFGVAAHEYAHSVLFSHGLKLPPWLSEGIAEVFSTVHITERRCEFGGLLPARVDTLRHHAWLPAKELLTAEPNSPLRETRDGSAIFYAESWALTDMLMSSPDYAPHFNDLIRVLNAGGTTSQEAFLRIYGKSPDAILNETRDWIAYARSSRQTLPSFPNETFPIEVTRISDRQARAMTADLLFATGQWERSEKMYKQLLIDSPREPELLASLGTVTLREENRDEAAAYFRRALDNNLSDAAVCYRYALLADEMNLPSEEIARALRRAVAIQPDFDDARFKLALLESNAGDFDAAVRQLQSMAKPSAKRAFAYWTTLAYAFSQLDKREEATHAAEQAAQFAVDSEQRARVAELTYIAQTDMAVRFTRDADGKQLLTTTRVPHGTSSFNPFIEPGDHIETATGKLREVQCSEGRLTSLSVESDAGILTLSVPDPMHVLIRNGPSEFYCGPQLARKVKIEYATAGKSGASLLRGIDFQ